MGTLFKLRGRRSQKSYATWMAIAFAISIVIGIALGAMGNTALVFLLLIPAIPLAVATVTITAQRFRDYGLTGWFALAWVPIGFIPGGWPQLIVSIIFAVAVGLPAGHTGPNDFGPDPRDYDDGYGAP